jgi:hypothetical protein
MSLKDNKLSDDEDFDVTDGPQDNSFDTTASTLFSDQKQSMEQAHEYVVKLEIAIKSGNVSLATEVAKILVGMRAAISVKTDANTSQSDHITVTIIVEDKTGPKQTVMWKLQPSISVFALKWKMFDRFGYSPDEQQWIIGKILAEDSDKLSDCGVRTSGSIIFLYLQTPTTSEAVVGNYSSQLSITSQSTNVSSGSLSEDRFLRPASLNRPEVISLSQPVQPSNLTTLSPVYHEQVGWQCPKCTFINEPTRPGCELCSCDRPATYQMPTGYTPSDRERKRLLEEQKLDKLLTMQASHVPNRTWPSEHSLDERGSFDLLLSGNQLMLTDEELATQLQQQENMLSRAMLNSRHLETDASFFVRRDQSH